MNPVTRATAIVAAAGLASFTYQKLADARDRRRFPPPGRLVNIGGRRLHVMEAGHGSPAVVIIPALADNVLGWVRIQQALASDTHVIVYDRAEIGWSDPPPHRRRRPELMAADLHALLTAADISPPYVLAGHSIGGIVARQFYAHYPDVTAGMLLVDSSHEQMEKRITAADWRRGHLSDIRVAARRQAQILGARRLAASLGLWRDLDASIARWTTPEYAGADRAITLSTRQKRVSVRELLMVLRMSGQPPELCSIPLTVLTRASPRGQQWPGRAWPVWAQMQDELAALSYDSVHVYAETAGHYIHLDEPDLVIQAIHDLVMRCR
jgi:pimeloyl-ACP methyl ester carboxylesterase